MHGLAGETADVFVYLSVAGPPRALQPDTQVFIFPQRVVERAGPHYLTFVVDPHVFKVRVFVIPAKEPAFAMAEDLRVLVEHPPQPSSAGLRTAHDEEDRDVFTLNADRASSL